VVVDGDVRAGCGLSSSAALECATATALADLHGAGLDRPTLAGLARRAENEVVGVPSGAMDQMVSMLGRAGHAVVPGAPFPQPFFDPLHTVALGFEVLAEVEVCAGCSGRHWRWRPHPHLHDFIAIAQEFHLPPLEGLLWRFDSEDVGRRTVRVFANALPHHTSRVFIDAAAFEHLVEHLREAFRISSFHAKCAACCAVRSRSRFSCLNRNFDLLAPTGAKHSELDWLAGFLGGDRFAQALLRHGRFTALLTGDAEAPVEELLLARGLLRPVDVLKVAHHGSSSSTTPSFLAATDPAVAVISSGSDNAYGHPSPQTLTRLGDPPGIALYRT
jgi:hypothetical protein